MKKIMMFMLVIVLCFSGTACSRSDDTQADIVPQSSQMRSICELATMECYYHNVAKYMEDDASGVLWWKKDRKFWVEYAGVVRIGIDASLVNIEVSGEDVTITIPPAKVLSCKVDEKTLTKDSFVIAKNSAKVEAEHQTEAFKQAQANMEKEAGNDTILLANAQQRAQKLLEDYVDNIGNSTGKSYKIKWVYLEGAEKLSTVDLSDIDTEVTE